MKLWIQKEFIIMDAIDKMLDAGDRHDPCAVTDFLRSKYLLLGTGMYAAVFLGPNGSVWRIVDKDSSYDTTCDYLDYCINNVEEFTPEVYQTFMYQGFHIARVKRYSPVNSFEYWKPYLDSVRDILEHIAIRLGAFENEYVILDDVLDLHKNNIMLDGKKLVITDPFCY